VVTSQAARNYNALAYLVSWLEVSVISGVCECIALTVGVHYNSIHIEPLEETMPDGAAQETARIQQDGGFENWLKLAPAPPQRRTTLYDVFISYRSSDRGWAMALYDALKRAGWKPFLDQYELVPGASLETSLEEALQASASRVILWSSRTKNSEWCKKERQAMRSIKSAAPEFQFVFAKLDGEPLPLFAQGDLYVDFEDSPEGPRGVNLLRIMCGLEGVPLSAAAVKEAQRVDEATKGILLQIKAAIDGDNIERLLHIATSPDPGLTGTSGPLLEASRGLISMGKYEEALKVLAQADVYFSQSIVLKQLRGLALRRLGRYQDAIDVLSELKAAGHQDPETLGILAAAWYVRYNETGKTIDLRRSRELYRTAFQADPASYYTGLNAATKSLFLGETEEAERLTDAVRPLVQQAKDGKDFWAACTLGELHLLKRDVLSASQIYQNVIDCHPARVGDLAGTRAQAETIASLLGLTAEEKEKLLAPFELLSL
jgi:tetratricopeptide (TPR) repeat protein